MRGNVGKEGEREGEREREGGRERRRGGEGEGEHCFTSQELYIGILIVHSSVRTMYKRVMYMNMNIHIHSAPQ